MDAAARVRIGELHESGYSFRQLAELFGKSRGAIAGIVWRARNPGKKTNGKGRGASPKRGVAHKHAKLTDAQVRAIRARREEGEKLAVLAAEFGVHEGHICQIASRKYWAHVL